MLVHFCAHFVPRKRIQESYVFFPSSTYLVPLHFAQEMIWQKVFGSNRDIGLSIFSNTWRLKQFNNLIFGLFLGTVREARNPTSAPSRGGGRGGRGGPGRDRGGRGAGIDPNRDFRNENENGFTGGYGGGGGVIAEKGEGGKPLERSRGGYGPPRQSFRGGRQGGYGNVEGDAGGEAEHPQRRAYERRSGTGRGYEMKRQGAGRGNWGAVNDDVIAQLRSYIFIQISFERVGIRCNDCLIMN